MAIQFNRRNARDFDTRHVVALTTQMTYTATPTSALDLTRRNTNITTNVWQSNFWYRSVPAKKARVHVLPLAQVTANGMSGAVEQSTNGSSWSTLVTFTASVGVTQDVNLPKFLRVAITTHTANTNGSVAAYLEV